MTQQVTPENLEEERKKFQEHMTAAGNLETSPEDPPEKQAEELFRMLQPMQQLEKTNFGQARRIIYADCEQENKNPNHDLIYDTVFAWHIQNKRDMLKKADLTSKDLASIKSLYNQVKKAIEDAGNPQDYRPILIEITGIPIAPRIKEGDTLTLATDKVNASLWNGYIDFSKTDEKHAIPIPMDSKNDPQTLDILISVFSEDSLSIRKDLNVFDKILYFWLGTMYRSGHQIVTYNKIYELMGGNGKPSKKDRARIDESITKLQSTLITISNEKEAIAHKKPSFIKTRVNLLYAKTGYHVKVNGTITNAAIYVTELPCLFQFAADRNEIANIEKIVLRVPGLSMTESNLEIQDYLIRRIEAARNANNSMSSTILFATICKETGTEEKYQKTRLRRTVTKILDWYKECRYISGYEIENLYKDNEKIILRIPRQKALPKTAGTAENKAEPASKQARKRPNKT